VLRRDRVPPGHHPTQDFPVLAAGPTPQVRSSDSDFRIVGEVDELVRRTWDEFQALPTSCA
jgi:DMSO/TMAO reductase YedYZ molybdopterin-dependent catalytic subunit